MSKYVVLYRPKVVGSPRGGPQQARTVEADNDNEARVEASRAVRGKIKAIFKVERSIEP